jgi:MFS family permease
MTERSNLDAATARWVLGLLLAVNLLDFIDRQVLYAVLPLVGKDLRLTDMQMGALASAFMLVFMCAAPIVGYWADRSPRNWWISAGVGVWSLATLASGLAGRYVQLFCARAVVGIGEASYGVASPSFVAEHYPPEKRAGALSIFSMAGPVGSALGYVLGASIGGRFGWKTAFYFAGVPGLVLTAFCWRLKEPRKQTNVVMARGRGAILADYSGLWRNAAYVRSTLATAAMTFGLGAYAVWMPTFYTRAWGFSVAKAGTIFGLLTVVAGVTGSLAGGWISDRFFKGTVRSCFLVSGVGFLMALPLICVAVLSRSLFWGFAALFCAEFFAFLNMGPLNAVIVDVTSPSVRSTAFAANIFAIHALGDAVSPTIVGWLSDVANLKTALIVAAIPLGLAGAICLWDLKDHEKEQTGAVAA